MAGFYAATRSGPMPPPRGRLFHRRFQSGMVGDFVTSGSEGRHDPECGCREAEAPVQGRLQGPAFRGVADPAGFDSAPHGLKSLILQAVCWYLRYPLSYRDIEELFLERGLAVDHATLNRWVLAYAPLIERRLRSFRKPHCGSLRIDESSIISAFDILLDICLDI